MKVRFSASGYGSKIQKYPNRPSLMDDVNNMAGDYEGEVQDYGEEIVLQDRNGEEIARWEIL